LQCQVCFATQTADFQTKKHFKQIQLYMALTNKGQETSFQHFMFQKSMDYELYVPATVHREQSVKKEYQQDAKI